MSSNPSSEPVSESTETDFTELLGPALAAAFAKKGYTQLTQVQRAVLEPEHAGRDLRISSQTGSGKTLAIGFALRDILNDIAQPGSPQAAAPRALVIAPTRELAKQVQAELAWLYAPMKLRIAAVTGGSSYRDEHRALAGNPAVVVGTPGRLLDHLNRGSIVAENVAAVVLDEADRMLDLGFRDELEAILKTTPEERLTHLVSATFSREVKVLADRFQREPVRVEGTPLGSANNDIEHVVYLVPPREQVDALVNVLLQHPDEQTLVFVRTRAEVAEITEELRQAGFLAGSLSGEMEQMARTRALAAFKNGEVRALVATDVAARGIDVQDIARVVQIDAPNDADTYTHRSGRTGRAGRKGTSALIVPPQALRRTMLLLERARVRARVQPVPTAEAIRAAQDQRWLTELERETETELSPRIRAQIARIVESGMTERALGALLIRAQQALGEPRDVTPVTPADRRPRNERQFGAKGRGPARPERDAGGSWGGPNRSQRDGGSPQRDAGGSWDTRPQRDAGGQQRDAGGSWDTRPQRDAGGSWDTRPQRDAGGSWDGPPRSERDAGGDWVPFRVTWGEAHGADPRRLVAMLCRRGNIKSQEIGAIRVAPTSSVVEVAASVAARFAQATQKPDSRDKRVVVTPLAAGGEPRGGFHKAPRRPFSGNRFDSP